MTDRAAACNVPGGNMARELEGQIALVTGAGRGFGKAIARRLAAEGAAVAVAARTRSQLDEVVAEIEAAGGRALAVPADVTDRAAVAQVVEETRKKLGSLSLFINNAGVPGPFGPMWEIDPDVWWKSQAVHIRAPLLFLREVLPQMIDRGCGRVIIVSAIASRMVAPYLSAYCVGKIAQTRIIEELAAETQGRGVSAFAIDPGFVFTGIAEETMSSPEAQRWLPHMVGRLRARKDAKGGDTDLYRCAQRCVDLASGRYDALSGRYMELTDDLDTMLRAKEKPA
jgi:NAD(P)-dependent dehydrogenase (short-subunit alcohol dehydrogenase family)